MMNTYKINYEQLRQRPEISAMLSALSRGFDKFGIDFYLVGAVARDVWMGAIHKITPGRTTGDIDFAVLINDKGTYEALKEYLINEEGFQAFSGNAFILFWKDKTEVDLLPFGAIEDEDGQVTASGLGLTNISLLGFTEVYEQSLPQLELSAGTSGEEMHQFKFCTLPGIVLLKMIAWDDRPERIKDIQDISDILNHFFDMYDNEIWNNHNDLFADPDVDVDTDTDTYLKHIAARVMGREMHKIAKRNEKLIIRINGILDANTKEVGNSKMSAIMASYSDNTVADNVVLLQQLKMGFTE